MLAHFSIMYTETRLVWVTMLNYDINSCPLTNYNSIIIHQNLYKYILHIQLNVKLKTSL